MFEISLHIRWEQYFGRPWSILQLCRWFTWRDMISTYFKARLGSQSWIQSGPMIILSVRHVIDKNPWKDDDSKFPSIAYALNGFDGGLRSPSHVFQF